MDHLNPEDFPNIAPSSAKAQAKDPVCGMDVNPATARYKTQHNGNEYFFCCAGCLAKFEANPEKILSSPPRPMAMPTTVTTSKLVSLGPAGAMQRIPPATIVPAAAASPAKPEAEPKAKPEEDAPFYICPMCPEVRQMGPGPCPKCGMALDSESPAIPASKTEYTCPMHPEIVRAEPGNCPICGMALEPRTTALVEENPELRDMTRRFWIALALTSPLLAIAMGSMLSSQRFMASPWNWALPWLELLLAT